MQWYEPYSEGAGAASLAAIQYHTNMNNPTGILADAGDLIYVMVDEIPRNGSTLYLGEVLNESMNNETTSGTELKQGLNIVPCINDNAHLFVYYTVTTTKTENGKRVPILENKLSNFSPIKIHIEGGRLNGFYNAQGDDPRVDSKDEFYYAPDSKEDLKYTLARATHPMYDMLGKYQVLHLHKDNTTYEDPSDGVTYRGTGVKTVYLGTEKAGGVYDPAVTMQTWDDICFAQRIMLGIQSAEDVENEFNRGYYSDIVGKGYSRQCGNTLYKADPEFYFSDYFNNRHFALSGKGNIGLSMNATNWRTYMNSDRIEDVLINLPNGKTQNIWHVAHEYGHLNQQPIKIAGTTETSNNVFTLASLYFTKAGKQGRTSSTNSVASVFMRNRPFLETGDGVIRMFWQLWLYYHVNQNNTSFYPRLFELLRKNPIKYNQGAGGKHDEKYDWLHFYKMCCIAAEEDLTEFFESYGFFVPIDNYPIEDYSHYNAVLYQKDINEARKDVGNMHLPENRSIMFIDDQVGVLTGSGTYGKPAAFQQKELTPSEDYEFTIDGTIVSITPGEVKGVGYTIRSAADNSLLGFANTDSFTLPTELLSELVAGTAKIYVVGPNSQLVEVKNSILDGTAEDLLKLLSKTFETFKNTVDEYVDENETKVGFLKKSKIDETYESFQSRINEVSTGNLDKTKIRSLISEILIRQSTIKDDITCQVEFQPGAAYRINNAEHKGHYMSAQDQQVINATFKQEFNQYWIIDSSDYDDNYTVLNMGYETYLYHTGVSNDKNVPLKKEDTDKFKLIPVEGKVGLFNIAAGGDLNKCISNKQLEGNALYYTNAELGAKMQWYLERVYDKEYFALRDKLAELNDKFLNDIIYDTGWHFEIEGEFERYMSYWDLYGETNQKLNNPALDKDQLQQDYDNLIQLYEDLKGYLCNSTIVTVTSIGFLADGVDNGYDESGLRMAFKSPKYYSEGMHNFEGCLALDTDIPDQAVSVIVEPVDINIWTMPKGQQIRDEYQKIFSTLAPEAALMEQLESLADYKDEQFYTNYFDGFYNEASGSLLNTGQAFTSEGETSYAFSLRLNVSCSGLYKVTLLSNSDDYVIFDKNNKIVTFFVEIYPNLNLSFEQDNGFNIEGYTFSSSDPEHDKTIYIPDDFINTHNMKYCTVYIPGLYFAEELSVQLGSENNNRSGKYYASKRNASTTSGRGASVYHASVDLSELKNKDQNSSIKLYVSVSKNGASSNFTFNVAVGDNFNVSTGIDCMEKDDENIEYYNLQGIRIHNPEHGIFIRRRGNKSEKVVF